MLTDAELNAVTPEQLALVAKIEMLILQRGAKAIEKIIMPTALAQKTAISATDGFVNEIKDGDFKINVPTDTESQIQYIKAAETFDTIYKDPQYNFDISQLEKDLAKVLEDSPPVIQYLENPIQTSNLIYSDAALQKSNLFPMTFDQQIVKYGVRSDLDGGLVSYSMIGSKNGKPVQYDLTLMTTSDTKKPTFVIKDRSYIDNVPKEQIEQIYKKNNAKIEFDKYKQKELALGSNKLLIRDLKHSALLGGGITAVIKIPELIKTGDIAGYATNVARSGLMSAGFSAANSYVSRFIAGPVAGIAVSMAFTTITSFYALNQTGDWDRFMKNMVAGGITTISGTLGGVLGGVAGATMGPVGAYAGAVAGSMLFGSVVGMIVHNGAKKPTRKEREAARLQEKLLREYKENLNKDGLDVPSTTNLVDVAKLAKENKLEVTGNWEWKKIFKTPPKPNEIPSLMGMRVFKESVRVILSCAKARSSSGDITEGLNLIISDLERF